MAADMGLIEPCPNCIHYRPGDWLSDTCSECLDEEGYPKFNPKTTGGPIGFDMFDSNEWTGKWEDKK
jgi:hypothetical protein